MCYNLTMRYVMLVLLLTTTLQAEPSKPVAQPASAGTATLSDGTVIKVPQYRPRQRVKKEVTNEAWVRVKDKRPPRKLRINKDWK